MHRQAIYKLAGAAPTRLRCCLNLRRNSHRRGTVNQTGTALIPAKGRLSFSWPPEVMNAPSFASNIVTSRLQSTATQESGWLHVMLQRTCMVKPYVCKLTGCAGFTTLAA